MPKKNTHLMNKMAYLLLWHKHDSFCYVIHLKVKRGHQRSKTWISHPRTVIFAYLLTWTLEITFLSNAKVKQGHQKSYEVTSGPNTYNIKFDIQGMLVGIFLLFECCNYLNIIKFDGYSSLIWTQSLTQFMLCWSIKHMWSS